MTCIVCSGEKFVVKNDQTELCANCDGLGVVGLARSAPEATELPSAKGTEADKEG